DDSTQILVSPEGITEGAWAEFSHVLFAYGGAPHAEGISLSPLALRRAAQDLGHLLGHHELEAEYDNNVKRLLDLHVREVHARREAERDRSSLSPTEVHARVRATGRFRRALTDNQVRDLGRLLRLAHGANFSVPGAGKTATLLAAYE